jgi:hypothetical protein
MHALASCTCKELARSLLHSTFRLQWHFRRVILVSNLQQGFAGEALYSWFQIHDLTRHPTLCIRHQILCHDYLLLLIKWPVQLWMTEFTGRPARRSDWKESTLKHGCTKSLAGKHEVRCQLSSIRGVVLWIWMPPRSFGDVTFLDSFDLPITLRAETGPN